MTSRLYPAEKYTYRVVWEEYDRRYVGVCSEFPELSCAAATHDGALGGIISIVGAELEKRQSTGAAIPDPVVIRLVGGRS